MMKKLFALLVCFALILSLASCQQTKPSPSDEGDTSTQSASALSAADDSTADLFVVDLDSVYHYEANENFTIESRQVVLAQNAGEYSALAQALKDYNDSRTTLCNDFSEAMFSEEDAQDAIADYFVSLGNDVRRSDSAVVSLLTTFASYAGGLHPNYTFTGISFDTQTGKQLTLEDVCTDTAALLDLVETQITESRPDAAFFSLHETLQDELKNGALSFTVDNECLSFFFSPYEIAPYAEGLITASISFDEHPELFNANYTTALDNYAVTMLSTGGQYSGIIGGKWIDFSAWGDCSAPDETDYYDSFSIHLNGESFDSTNNLYFYSFTPALMYTKEAGLFLYVDFGTDSDYHFMHVYDLNGEKPVFVTELDNHAFAGELISDSVYGTMLPLAPRCFPMSSHFNPLSTVSCTRYYHLTADGTPEGNTEDYFVNIPFVLTAKADIPATEINTETNEVLGAHPIKSGSKLTAYATNGTSYVDFFLEDGTLCRIDADISTYPQTINGTEAEDLLDGIVYAG